MSRGRHLLPGLALALLAGCATGGAVRPGADHAAAAPTALGPDGVLVDMVVLECPLGDRYLNGELWESTDEQAVPFEQKAVLEDHGFRVGHLVGTTPRKLQALLTTERHCATKWRQILPAGKPITLRVGAMVPEMRYQVGPEGEIFLEQAEPFLVTVPTLTGDGRTRLQFTPHIQYGERRTAYQPAHDRTGWELSRGRRNMTYPALGWEVVLAPNEYVVIGAALDTPQTLGYQCFVQEDGKAAVQRVLVIRTARSTADLPDPIPEGAAAGAPGGYGPPPLALQATWTLARGSTP